MGELGICWVGNKYEIVGFGPCVIGLIPRYSFIGVLPLWDGRTAEKGKAARLERSRPR